MRIIRFLILYVMVTVLGLMALAFLGLNHFTVQLDLIAAQYTVSVAWVMVGAALFGFIMALLVLLPGRLAAALNIRALDREARDLEKELEKQQVLRAHLLSQHEALIGRHEQMLVRHQVLMTDHSQVTAERDQARAQLATSRAARPIAAAHNAGTATALRLLPAPEPVSATSAPAAQSIAQAETAKQPAPEQLHSAPAPEPRRITPGPWRSIQPVASAMPVAPAAASLAPTTVPVVSAPPAVARPAEKPAGSMPATAEPPAPVAQPARPARLPKPTKPPRPPKPPRQPKVMPALRRVATRAQSGIQDTRQSVTETGVRLGQQLRQATSALWTTVIAQAEELRAKLAQLRQRISSTPDDAD